MAISIPNLPKFPQVPKIPGGLANVDLGKIADKLGDIKPTVEVKVSPAPLIIGGALAVALIYFVAKRR
jgi:hypothetical protein